MLQSQIGPRLSEKTTCNISWDSITLGAYSTDASSYIVKPAAVAFPRNENDMIKILRFASRHKIPVTPRGGGTGLVGGALGRGIILDMRHFNTIRVGQGSVQVGSGVFKGELDRVLRKHGRFFGPNPSVGPFCTVGGMIGTNASGSHSLKYGSTIDNLIGVKIVTSKGDLVSLPSNNIIAKKVLKITGPEIQKQFPRITKNSCGYRIDKVTASSDTQKIIAGSEGTLGIIVSAKLRTITLSKRTVLIIVSYRTLKEAVADVPRILKIGPSSVEIIDHNIIRYIKTRLPRGARCLLFVEFDDNVTKKKTKAKHMLSDRMVTTTSDPKQIRQWWTYRNSALSYSLKSVSKQETVSSLIEDATVPVHRLPLLLDLVEYLTSKYPMRVITYGHAGNGNLHIRPILKKKDSHLLGKIAQEFFSGVISIGGSITGEHGDGLARSKFVKAQYGSEIYSRFRKVKQIFDPANTLNPGKIVT
ncbi:MAG: FAD-binding oxidoreductase [Thaumarchaeota archaeon]|nr:FAD-binding oxidoreductase [Nitrososphaerota archaeon]